MTGKRVLITGATGFIGSRLTQLLLSLGQEVFALVKPDRQQAGLAPKAKLVLGDLRDERSMQSVVDNVRPELCFHLAWGARPEQAGEEENETALRGSLALLHALAETQCRTVVAGTSAEYGIREGLLNEEMECEPVNPYGRCKLALRDAAQRLSGSFVHARIFNVYGPGEDPERLVPYLIRGILAGKACETTAGEQSRDYIHSDDLAAALWALAKSEARGTVNVATGTPVKIKQIAKTIAALLGRDDLLKLGALTMRTSEPLVRHPDVSKLLSVTDWKPSYDLASGLESTIEWWRAAEK